MNIVMRPNGNRILVKKFIAEETTSASGIVIPTTGKDKLPEGEVVAVSYQVTSEAQKKQLPAIKLGDVVIFGKYDGFEYEENGEEYLIINMDDVLGIKPKR